MLTAYMNALPFFSYHLFPKLTVCAKPYYDMRKLTLVMLGDLFTEHNCYIKSSHLIFLFHSFTNKY